MFRFVKIFASTLLFVLLAIALGGVLPQPALRSDFMSLYHALAGWRAGASFYDFAAQYQLILKTAPGISIEQYPYFPYPPWYGGTFFFLAFLPFDWAYRTWTILNLGILALSAHLLSTDLDKRTRLFALIAFILFFPSVGLIGVGNYTLPVLLGGALFIFATRKEDAPLAALALALLTFKPHIGFIIALSGFVWLMTQKTIFARRARGMTIAAGFILAGIGFAIEPRWPLTFPQSILTWQASPYIHACSYCGNLATMLARVSGDVSTYAVSGVLLLLAITLAYAWRKNISDNPAALISLSAALTGFVLPYMVNYDYVILLIPLTYAFTHSASPKIRAALIALYLLPWLSFVFGRASGNIILAITGVTLFLLLLTRTKE